jgi:hypothetical protein
MIENVKRMRYFNTLFLKEDEFKLEQNYHMRMRRLHNRHLHTYGIVYGLDVINDNGQLKVTKGMALDNVVTKIEDDEGNVGEEISREIVLPDDSFPPLTPDQIKNGVYICISHDKEKEGADLEKGGTDETGATQKIHWEERAKIEAIQVTGTDKQTLENLGKIVLAKVQDSTGNISTSSIQYYDTSNNPYRSYAGACGKLTLSIENPPDDLILASIEGKKIGNNYGIYANSEVTQFNGDCIIDGDLTVNGSKTTVKTDNLVVKDNIITVHKKDPWNSDPWGTDSYLRVAGLEVYRGDQSRSKIIWNEIRQRWTIGLGDSYNDIGNTYNDLIYGTVSGNGNVGIGTTAPNAKLHISVDDDAQQMISSYFSAANRQSWLFLEKGRGTAAAPLSVQSGDEIFRIYGRAYNAGAMRAATRISSIVDGAPGVMFVPGALAFYTSTNLSAENEVMRITSSGKVGIGTGRPDKLPLCILSSDTTWGSGISLDNTSATSVNGKRYGITSNRGRFTISDMDNTVDRLVIDKDGNVVINGNISTTKFIGDGSNLTGITAATIGALSSKYFSISTVNFNADDPNNAIRIVNVGFQPKLILAIGSANSIFFGGKAYGGALYSFADLRTGMQQTGSNLNLQRGSSSDWWSSNGINTGNIGSLYFYDGASTPAKGENISVSITSFSSTGLTLALTRSALTSISQLDNFSIVLTLLCMG